MTTGCLLMAAGFLNSEGPGKVISHEGSMSQQVTYTTAGWGDAPVGLSNPRASALTCNRDTEIQGPCRDLYSDVTR